MSNTSAFIFTIWPSRSTCDCSSWIGSPNSFSTSSRMIAPKPQQMQSRNDMLKVSVSRRVRRFMASPSPGSGASRRSTRARRQK